MAQHRTTHRHSSSKYNNFLPKVWSGSVFILLPLSHFTIHPRNDWSLIDLRPGATVAVSAAATPLHRGPKLECKEEVPKLAKNVFRSPRQTVLRLYFLKMYDSKHVRGDRLSSDASSVWPQRAASEGRIYVYDLYYFDTIVVADRGGWFGLAGL